VQGITGTTSYLFSDAPSRARRIVQGGDVLISTVRTYLRAIAPVIDPPKNLIASTGFAVIRPRENGLRGEYLGYLLRAEWWIAEIISQSVGVSYPAINASDLVGIKVPIPAIAEQTQIARFLDYETARIDALIAEQQRLIELLKEKRQAVISHAVTKGLDPTAPMKDSGVEWLGKVPAHWEVLKLKRIATLQSGDFITSESINSEGPYPVFGGNGLRGYTKNHNHEGDFVLIGRQGALCGNINYAKGQFWASEHAVVVSPRNGIVIRWMGELLRSMNLNQYSVSAAQPGLAVERITDLYIPLPSESEQIQIARLLDHETARIDALNSEANESVSLLQERRSALISAAVTGKIDVRGWQPPASASHTPNPEPIVPTLPR